MYIYTIYNRHVGLIDKEDNSTHIMCMYIYKFIHIYTLKCRANPQTVPRPSTLFLEYQAFLFTANLYFTNNKIT